MCGRSVADGVLAFSRKKEKSLCIKLQKRKKRRKETPMNPREKLLNGLSEEQIALVRDCANVEDLVQLAHDEGVELNDEQLSAVTGGACNGTDDEDKRPEKDTHKKFES